MTNDKLADEIEIYLKRHDKVGPGLGAMHWLEKARDALRAERPQPGEMVMVPREQFKWNYQCPSEARECEARDFCAKHQCCGRSGEPLLLTYALAAAEAERGNT